MMKIYADVLVITNCIINMIYLQTTAKLTHRRTGAVRLFLGSLFGGMLALLIAADGSSFIGAVIITVVKFTGIALTLLIGIKFKSVGSYFRCLAVFAAVRAAYTGLIIVYWQLSGSKRIYVRNYTTYFDISLLKLTTAVITAYILLSLYDMVVRHFRRKTDKYEAVFRSGDYQVRLPAVADSGNTLCDSFTGLPVVIFCCSDMYLHFGLDNFEQSALMGFRLTPYKTIDGQGLIAVTSKGDVTIYNEKGTERMIKCCVGIKPTDSRHSRAIFAPELLD